MHDTSGESPRQGRVPATVDAIRLLSSDFTAMSYLKAKHYPTVRFVMPPFRFALDRASAPLVATAALLLLAGCGSSAPIGNATTPATVEARALAPVPATAVEAQLLRAASEWMGVPYRFGGTTKSGVDCSALVRAVYAGAFSLHLTRSTRTQVNEGIAVRRDDLRTGDLVFFRTGPNQRHVGIYLDGGRLLHASSSRDRVLVDDFNQRHFQETYWTARRLLDVRPGDGPAPPVFASTAPPAQPVARPEAARPGPAPSGPARSGW